MSATIAAPGIGIVFLLIYAVVFTFLQASRTDDRRQVFQIVKMWSIFTVVHLAITGAYLLMTTKNPQDEYSPAPLFYTFVIQFVIAKIALFSITKSMIALGK